MATIAAPIIGPIAASNTVTWITGPRCASKPGRSARRSKGPSHKLEAQAACECEGRGRGSELSRSWKPTDTSASGTSVGAEPLQQFLEPRRVGDRHQHQVPESSETKGINVAQLARRVRARRTSVRRPRYTPGEQDAEHRQHHEVGAELVGDDADAEAIAPRTNISIIGSPMNEVLAIGAGGAQRADGRARQRERLAERRGRRTAKPQPNNTQAIAGAAKPALPVERERVDVDQRQCRQGHVDDEAVQGRRCSLGQSAGSARNPMPSTKHATSRMKFSIAPRTGR